MLHATHNCIKAKEYSKDLHFNISLDCKVHHTQSGYMDIEMWLINTTQFYHVFGAYPVKNQTIFFDGHDIFFDDRPLIHMEHWTIQPFILKTGKFLNNQTNDNVPNFKLKSHYNEVKYVWILKYRMTNCLPQQIKSILVIAWDAFNVSSRKFIRESFVKIKLPPLIPTELTTNTHACDAFIQVSSGSKDEETNKISHRTVAPIE